MQIQCHGNNFHVKIFFFYWLLLLLCILIIVFKLKQLNISLTGIHFHIFSAVKRRKIAEKQNNSLHISKDILKASEALKGKQKISSM